jgi:vitamin B12 transporter
VSRQQNYGAEFEASYRVRSWDVSLNYTYTDGRTTSAYDGTGVALPKDTSYYNLFRIPRHAVNASVSYRLGKAWMIRAQLRAVSKRQEFIYGSSPETENGYAVLDLYGEYNFAGQFKLFLDLRNITNTVYFDFPGYNCRKFNFITGIRFNL